MLFRTTRSEQTLSLSISPHANAGFRSKARVKIQLYAEASDVRARKCRTKENQLIKLQRAHDECLGAKRRRRTWKTAISLGER
jgi:hypothetical protein